MNDYQLFMGIDFGLVPKPEQPSNFLDQSLALWHFSRNSLQCTSTNQHPVRYASVETSSHRTLWELPHQPKCYCYSEASQSRLKTASYKIRDGIDTGTVSFFRPRSMLLAYRGHPGYIGKFPVHKTEHVVIHMQQLIVVISICPCRVHCIPWCWRY